MTPSAPPISTLIEFTLGRKVQHSTKRLSRLNQRRVYLAALLASDLVLLVSAFALAYVLRFYSDLPIFRTEITPWPGYYLRLAALLIPAWLILFWAYRLYDWDVLLGGTREYELVFQASVTGAVLITVIQFLTNDLTIARGWVGLSWALAFAFVACGRFGLRRLAYASRRRGYLLAPALIVGANGEGRLLGEQLLSWPTSGLTLLGYIDDDVQPGTRMVGNLYALGGLDQLDAYVEQYGIEELILASSAISSESTLGIFRKYGTSPAVHLRLSSGLFDIMTTGLEIKEMAYVPLIGVNRVRLSRTDLVMKTLLDYGMTLASLLVVAPMFVLIAILIRLDSPGPIFYRRRVMGLNGGQFDALKFRTMHVNGDQILAANPALLDRLATTHKIKGDPRITRVGMFLRKYSLDELPQLINVLKRDMSLVGPRMISPPELRHYGQWAMNLLTVRPGLTGQWQVSGRSDVTYEERVRLDMFYIRNYSLWLDLQLMLRTLPVVLSGRGAY